jgi:hypothetical protein
MACGISMEALMLPARFVPHNEFHVFHGAEWQFSVAELRLQRDDSTHLEPLAHQYCLRSPDLDQVAFDVRDIRRIDRHAAWDPHLRVGQLTRLLDKSFGSANDIVDVIAPFMSPLDASVRFHAPPPATGIGTTRSSQVLARLP